MTEHVCRRRPGANCPRSHSYRSRAISGAIRCNPSGLRLGSSLSRVDTHASLRAARNMKHPRTRREQDAKPRRTNARCTGHGTLVTAWRATTRRALDPTAHHNQIESTLATACSRTEATRGLGGTRRMNRVTVSCRPNWGHRHPQLSFPSRDNRLGPACQYVDSLDEQGIREGSSRQDVLPRRLIRRDLHRVLGTEPGDHRTLTARTCADSAGPHTASTPRHPAARVTQR